VHPLHGSSATRACVSFKVGRTSSPAVTDKNHSQRFGKLSGPLGAEVVNQPSRRRGWTVILMQFCKLGLQCQTTGWFTTSAPERTAQLAEIFDCDFLSVTAGEEVRPTLKDTHARVADEP